MNAAPMPDARALAPNALGVFGGRVDRGHGRGPDPLPICGSPETAPVKMGGLLSELLLLPGWRYRADLVKNWWYHIGDRVDLPLPAPLAFLYPILRVPIALVRLAGRR